MNQSMNKIWHSLQLNTLYNAVKFVIWLWENVFMQGCVLSCVSVCVCVHVCMYEHAHVCMHSFDYSSNSQCVFTRVQPNANRGDGTALQWASSGHCFAVWVETRSGFLRVRPANVASSSWHTQPKQQGQHSVCICMAETSIFLTHTSTFTSW